MNFRFLSARLAAFSLTVAAVFPVSAASQDQLPDVVVVGSRFEEPRLQAPTTIQVISQQDIAQSNASSVPDVLQMLAGMNVRSVVASPFGFNATVDLGGFGVTAAQNTLILLDGRRLNPIDASDIDWSAVALTSIVRIEIAQGAAGVQYGAGSSGGVINIITDSKREPRTDVSVRLGSFSARSADVNLDRPSDDVSVRVHAGATRTDGWRENAQGESRQATTQVRKNLQGSAYVYGELALSQQHNGLPGGVLGQVDQVAQTDLRAAKFNNVDARNSIEQSTLRLGANAALSERTFLYVNISASHKNSAFVQPYYDTADSFNTTYGVVTGAGKSTLSGDEYAVSPKLRTEWAGGHSVVYGLDVSQARQSGANSFSTLAQQFILANQGPYQYQGNILNDQQSVDLRSQSLYALARLKLSSDLDLSLGARHQQQSFEGKDLNKSSGVQAAGGQFAANAHEAGLSLRLDPTSRTYVRLHQSYRFANTDEYWGYDVYGNRVFSGELRPQTSNALELGYDMKTTREQLSLMLSQSTTQHEIRYNPDLYRNSNLTDNIQRTSLVANWIVQLLKKTQLTLSARLQRAVFANGLYQGEQLGLVPRAVYSLGWKQVLDGRNQMGLHALHVSQQAYDAAPGSSLDAMPSYTTVDAFWSHVAGRMETRVTFKNITNAKYASYGGYGFVSTPGASGTNSYYFFPGDPRALLLSLNYRF